MSRVSVIPAALSVRHLLKTRSGFGMKEAPKKDGTHATLVQYQGALTTTVGGIPSCRFAVHLNSIAALQVRTAARQG